jgi:uncharacterized protein (TIGR00106 family)
MHSYTISASIQILPLTQDRHPYEWVDEAIDVIQQAGITYEVGPFATVIEGRYEEVMKVIHAINEHLYEKGCVEWINNIQLQIRSQTAITSIEKVQKYQ